MDDGQRGIPEDLGEQCVVIPDPEEALAEEQADGQVDEQGRQPGAHRETHGEDPEQHDQRPDEQPRRQGNRATPTSLRVVTPGGHPVVSQGESRAHPSPSRNRCRGGPARARRRPGGRGAVLRAGGDTADDGADHGRRMSAEVTVARRCLGRAAPHRIDPGGSGPCPGIRPRPGPLLRHGPAPPHRQRTSVGVGQEVGPAGRSRRTHIGVAPSGGAVGALLAPETRRVLQAYSEGVNAYLESRSRNRLSPSTPCSVSRCRTARSRTGHQWTRWRG